MAIGGEACERAMENGIEEREIGSLLRERSSVRASNAFQGLDLGRGPEQPRAGERLPSDDGKREQVARGIRSLLRDVLRRHARALALEHARLVRSELSRN